MTKILVDKLVLEQALEALEYAQQDRECPSTTRQAITALRAALAAPDTCTWQPMDTAPFDTDLLVIKESGFICQDYRSKQYPTTWTYWMPLPNAPIKQAEGENT